MLDESTMKEYIDKMGNLSEDVVILVAEDKDPDFLLITKRVRLGGITNKIIRLANGRKALDFLFMKGRGAKRERNVKYLLLLDLNISKVEGIEILRKIKDHKELSLIPVIVLTARHSVCQMNTCHKLGCHAYMLKPVDDIFVKAVYTLSQSISSQQSPVLPFHLRSLINKSLDDTLSDTLSDTSDDSQFSLQSI